MKVSQQIKLSSAQGHSPSISKIMSFCRFSKKIFVLPPINRKDSRTCPLHIGGQNWASPEDFRIDKGTVPNKNLIVEKSRFFPQLRFHEHSPICPKVCFFIAFQLQPFACSLELRQKFIIRRVLLKSECKEFYLKNHSADIMYNFVNLRDNLKKMCYVLLVWYIRCRILSVSQSKIPPPPGTQNSNFRWRGMPHDLGINGGVNPIDGGFPHRPIQFRVPAP